MPDPARRAARNPYAQISPNPVHFANVNAVSSSMTPAAARMKKTAGKPAPNVTATASPANVRSSERLIRRRSRASAPTNSLYISARPTATAVTTIAPIVCAVVGGCCSSATTSARPRIAP